MDKKGTTTKLASSSTRPIRLNVKKQLNCITYFYIDVYNRITLSLSADVSVLSVVKQNKKFVEIIEEIFTAV